MGTSDQSLEVMLESRKLKEQKSTSHLSEADTTVSNNCLSVNRANQFTYQKCVALVIGNEDYSTVREVAGFEEHSNIDQAFEEVDFVSQEL